MDTPREFQGILPETHTLVFADEDVRLCRRLWYALRDTFGELDCRIIQPDGADKWYVMVETQHAGRVLQFYCRGFAKGILSLSQVID